MTKAEFADLLARMVKRPVLAVNGRHVYLWHGWLSSLQGILPAGLDVQLDLYALASGMERTPHGDEAARRMLQAVVAQWLSEHAVSGRQQVVTVSGCSLLMRYNVPLVPFFQVASEGRAIVFVVSPQDAPTDLRRLPHYVSVRSSATLDYLRAALPDQAVIGDTTR